MYFGGPKNLWHKKSRGISGNVMLALFAAIGAVGVIGATGMTVMKGPVRSMHNVTQKTIAENNMIASAKLAIMAAANQANGGDCDADTIIEPLPWSTSGTGPFPTGGGYLPSAIGASLQDPWGNTYGYCVWDHGTAIQTTCPTPTLRLRGVAGGGPVIAVISSGADRIFQTSCANAPAYINRVAGSDDIIMSHTYAEAIAASGGLWNLQSGDPGTAEINKNLEVKNAGGTTTFELDKESGIGDFVGLRTGSIAAKGTLPVTMAGGLRMDTETNVTQCTLPLHAGTLRYHSTDGLQVCNGTEWISAGGSPPPIFQEVNQAANVGLSVSGTPASNLVSMTVTTPGRYIILASSTTYAAQGYTYHSSSCSLVKNAIVLSSSGNYDGIVTGGSTSYIPHNIYDYETLVAGDVLKLSCSVTTNAPSAYGAGSRIQIISLVSAEDGGGGGGGGTGANIPNGTIVAFALDACPSGWSEYTPARGRFLRGRDPSGTIDPDGIRNSGSLQADEFKSHTHLTGQSGIGNTSGGNWFLRSDVGNSFASGAAGGAETRPKNVAVTYCQYDGIGLGPNTDVLDDLTDVVISSPQNGHVLSYNGSHWVNATGSSQWVTSGSNIYYNTGNVGIGTINPTSKLHISGSNPTITLQDTKLISDPALTAGMLIQDSNGASVGYMGDGGSTSNLMQIWAYVDRIALGTSLAHPITFHTNYNPSPSLNASERMRITPDGNVGIGTMTPALRFHTVLATSDNVAGSGVGGSYPIARFTAVASNIPRGLEIGVPTGGITSPVYLKILGTSNRFSILNQYDAESLSILDNGNVGIGTINPAAPLHIMSPSAQAIIAQLQRSTYATVSQLRLTDGGLNFFMSADSGSTFSASPSLFMAGTGWVGVGTSSPSAPLHISPGPVKIDSVNIPLVFNETDRATGTAGKFWRMPVDNGYLRFDVDPAGNGNFSPYVTPLSLHPNGEVVVASQLKGGGLSNFHIDSTTPSMGVYLNWYSTGNVYARGTLLASSDIRLKKDIKPIESSLDKLGAMNGVYFQWKDPQRTGQQVGLIAQDVEKVFPELVKEDAEGFKTVSYSALVAPLINAVKEMKGIVDGLSLKLDKVVSDVASLFEKSDKQQKEIDTLQQENKLLRERIDALEAKMTTAKTP